MANQTDKGYTRRMRLIRTEADLKTAMKALKLSDPALARAASAGAWPALRLLEPGFASLLKIIVEQQLSVASANAIWARLCVAVDPLTPLTLIQSKDEILTGCGLGRAKARYARALAEAVNGGSLELATVTEMPPDAAIAYLTRIKGIGPWTAEVYLLFCAGHPDVLPAGDLALQEAARLLYNLPSRPTAGELREIGQAWQPWRGVAARLLWNYYRIAKPAPAAAKP